MQVDVRTKGFEVTDGIREHVERRVQFGLSRFGSSIEHVKVSMADVNGHQKGGPDKQVAIMVEGPHLKTVRVEETGADAYAAIDMAVGRAAQSVGRALEILHEKHRGGKRE
jgi:ribosomal subunit interface protein